MTDTAPRKRKKKNWRAVLRAIHRDLGYACIGLTVLYAISGVAVNHIEDWNPSYTFETERVALGALELEEVADGVELRDETVREILGRLDLPTEWDTVFQKDPRSLRVIQDGARLDVDLQTGSGVLKHTHSRPLIHEANVLHLNHKKRLWTWVADAFAVSLALLALSGAFILKGRQGLFRRGLWFTVGGIALPVFFLWLYGT